MLWRPKFEELHYFKCLFKLENLKEPRLWNQRNPNSFKPCVSRTAVCPRVPAQIWTLTRSAPKGSARNLSRLETNQVARFLEDDLRTCRNCLFSVNLRQFSSSPSEPLKIGQESFAPVARQNVRKSQRTLYNSNKLHLLPGVLLCRRIMNMEDGESKLDSPLRENPETPEK